MEVLFLVAFLIVVGAYWSYQKFVVEAKEYICANCKTVGRAQYRQQGNFMVELMLWLFFIIPGLIYSAWRGSKKIRCCKACGSETLVPLDTPRGRELQSSEKSSNAG